MSATNNEVKIPPFSGATKYSIVQWMKLFNKIATSKQLDDMWKYTNFSQYITGDAFEFYLSCCMDNCATWPELEQAMIKRFQPFCTNPFESFIRLNIKDCAYKIDEYFNKKTELGTLAGLDNTNMISGLNNGLAHELKFHMQLREITDLGNWLIQATKIQSAINEYRTPQKGNIPVEYKNFRPPSTSRSLGTNLATTPDNSTTATTANVISNSSTKPPARGKPKNPCYYCFNRGLPDPYHYSNECRNRRPRQTAIQQACDPVDTTSEEETTEQS